jgi:ribonuclease P protein component
LIDGITRRQTFDQLRRDGIRVRGSSLTLTYLGDERPRPAVAFAISRKVGGAVVRNRCRRRVRALLDARATAGTLRPGAYVVQVRTPLDRLDPPALGAEIDGLLRSLEGRRRG